MKKLISELEVIKKDFESEYALHETGYKEGILKAIELINNYNKHHVSDTRLPKDEKIKIITDTLYEFTSIDNAKVRIDEIDYEDVVESLIDKI